MERWRCELFSAVLFSARSCSSKCGGSEPGDPMQMMENGVSKANETACVTSLLCLWLEVVQLPRRRWLSELTQFMKSFGFFINVGGERAKLENDDTLNNVYDGREVLSGVKTQFDAVTELEIKMDGQVMVACFRSA
ncbi:hypothetical protein ERJ75_000128900 [Trypanosoma vivax]|nr:hypothetical protein ERJ75_000128900 [Trypanosoma vivax]